MLPQLLFKLLIGSNSTHVLLWRTYSFKWFAALALSSFSPRCKLLFTVATGAWSRGNLLRRQVLLVAENQHRALRFRQVASSVPAVPPTVMCAPQRLCRDAFHLHPQVQAAHHSPP